MGIQATLSLFAQSTDQVHGKVAGYAECPSLRRRHFREALYDVAREQRLLEAKLARESRARARRRNQDLQASLVALEAKFARRRGAR
jgi:hypothetical protein